MVSKDLIKKTQERKRNLHSRFLQDLSMRLLPKLFSDLGITDYTVEEKFIEPRSDPPFKEEISPDVVIAYKNPNLNILLIEAKLSTYMPAKTKLERQLACLKGFVGTKQGAESLYELLGKKVSLETLSSCGIRSVAVYRTKSGGVRIYKTEQLR